MTNGLCSCIHNQRKLKKKELKRGEKTSEKSKKNKAVYNHCTGLDWIGKRLGPHLGTIAVVSMQLLQAAFTITTTWKRVISLTSAIMSMIPRLLFFTLFTIMSSLATPCLSYYNLISMSSTQVKLLSTRPP